MALEAGHTPFITVHANTFWPIARLLAAGFVTEIVDSVLPPETTDQLPVPVEGEAAANVAVSAHTVWFMPALADAGLESRLTVMDEEEGGHTPFEIVHANWFAPVERPFTGVVAEIAD